MTMRILLDEHRYQERALVSTTTTKTKTKTTTTTTRTKETHRFTGEVHGALHIHRRRRRSLQGELLCCKCGHSSEKFQCALSPWCCKFRSQLCPIACLHGEIQRTDVDKTTCRGCGFDGNLVGLGRSPQRNLSTEGINTSGINNHLTSMSDHI